jgi:hypothetical protein
VVPLLNEMTALCGSLIQNLETNSKEFGLNENIFVFKPNAMHKRHQALKSPNTNIQKQVSTKLFKQL